MNLKAITFLFSVLATSSLSASAAPGQMFLREYYSGKIFYEPIASAQFDPSGYG